MKTTMTALALLSGLTSAAAAKEVYRNEDGDVAVRGSPCQFSAFVDGSWQTSANRCSMYKNAGTNNTLVWIGQGRMLIKRDPDERGFAKLYRVIPGTDELGFMGNAVADGPCWVGKGVRFCGR
jgi:hypothetical protein